MALWILRIVFLVVTAGVGSVLVRSPDPQSNSQPFSTFVVIMLVAVAIIAGDMLIRHKRLEIISSVYFGIVVGLILAYIVSLALTPFLDIYALRNSLATAEKQSLAAMVQLTVGAALCYACISLLLQTKDDFRFVIPYVEFAKEVKGLKPYIIDTSVVIDGRIADVVETHVLDNQLIMPRFVLNELHNIADSSDKMRRSRGRRGLDILNRLRSDDDIDLKIFDRELPEMTGQPVDMKLVLLAKHLEGKLVTGDYNLNKIARLHNVPVINLNDLANALKPVFLPGENVEVRIVKPGEEDGQGVGYLDDGTMIVVEGGRPYINDTVRIAVTSVLQTSAGRMIFGRYAGLPEAATK
jgi:uncharacterized protein YacL